MLEAGIAGIPIIAEVSIGKNWGEMRKLGASQGRRRDGAEEGSRTFSAENDV